MRLLCLLALLVAALPAQAQSADWPAADPADVASTKAIVDAAYKAISGPSDAPRDWDRFRSLFHPAARLVPTGPQPGGGWAVQPSSVDEYVEIATNAFQTVPLFQGKGFYEVEAARRVERFGNIAHVWSTYESRLDPSEEPFQLGINTIQLVHDGERWWILSILWQAETDDASVPAAYLSE